MQKKMKEIETVKMTSYSHGSGCGCKIAPETLEQILQKSKAGKHENLLVGNDQHDDAAAYDLQDGKVLLSTTDFFMPIVDDPFTFGSIAAVNAISDIYAMGGRPLMAVAILGWPIDKLSPQVAAQVVAGGKHACSRAGIPLAGGHSIDSPEPIFGLAVNGLVNKENLKTNAGTRSGDLLFLTKKLGVGILSTAEKKNLLQEKDVGLAAEQMLKLNSIGEQLADKPWVHAVTDVTGFGLLGHTLEMCEAAEVHAKIFSENVLTLTNLQFYIEKKSIPGGAFKNWKSYGEEISLTDEYQKIVLADPQTSGGLLIAIDKNHQSELEQLFKQNDLQEFIKPVGECVSRNENEKTITVV